MTKELTTRQLKNKFRKLFIEEFEDPNEAFMDFMLDLIPKEIHHNLQYHLYFYLIYS